MLYTFEQVNKFGQGTTSSVCEMYYEIQRSMKVEGKSTFGKVVVLEANMSFRVV